MPEEKTVTEATEKVASEQGAVTEESESLQEQGTEETTESAETKTESTDAVAESSTAEVKKVGTEEESVTDEIDEILNLDKGKEKDNVQKRIDSLVAQLRSTQEELVRLKTEKSTSEGKTPEYSDSQLKQAMKKAMEDGDADLVLEIMQYRETKLVDKLKKEYFDEQKKQQEAVQSSRNEWTQICRSFEYLTDPNESELYPGSRKDLNLNDETSALYQVALALFKTNDEEKWKYYHSPGGQAKAVADALAMILRRKKSMAASKEKTQLERKLAKEKMKSSLATGGHMSEEKVSSEPKTAQDVLNDYVKERQAMKRKAEGGSF